MIFNAFLFCPPCVCEGVPLGDRVQLPRVRGLDRAHEAAQRLHDVNVLPPDAAAALPLLQREGLSHHDGREIPAVRVALDLHGKSLHKRSETVH